MKSKLSNFLFAILILLGVGYFAFSAPESARAANQTISGIVYTNDETTAYGTVTAVNLSVNGAAFQTVSSTITTGAWSFTVADPVAGDIITIWLDTNGVGSVQGSLVIRYGLGCTGSPDCTGLKLVRDKVSLQNRHTNSITNADLSVCDNDSGTGCTDTDIGFTVTSNNITTTWATNEIGVLGVYAPGGNVTTQKLDLFGIYSGGTETITLSGTGTNTTCSNASQLPLCVQSTGIFMSGSSTVVYTGNGATVPTKGYYNLELKPSSSSAQVLSAPYGYTGYSFTTAPSGNDQIQGIVFYDNFFYMTDTTDAEVYKYNANGNYASESFDTSASGAGFPTGITAYDGFFWIADLVDAEVYKYQTNGTYTGVSFDTGASGNGTPRSITYGGGYFWIVDDNDQAVYKYNTDGTYTGTSISTSGSGAVGPYGVVYANNHLWVADAVTTAVYKYSLTGTYTGTSFDTSPSGKVFPTSIAFAHGTFFITDWNDEGAYQFLAGLSVANNLTVGNGTNQGATGTANDPDIFVGGNVNISAGATFTAPDVAGNIISVGGNWTNAGTFTHSSRTVEFTATDTANTINPGASSFFNVTFNGVGGSWTPVTNTMTLAGDLTLTAGTLDESGGTPSNLTVNGHIQCGTTCGAFNFTTAGTVTQSVGAVGTPKQFGTNVINDSTNWTFYNLTFYGSTTTAQRVQTNSEGIGTILVHGTMTITAATFPRRGIFAPGDRIWVLTSSSTPLVVDGLLLSDTATFRFTGDGASVPSVAYYNLEVQPSGSSGQILSVSSQYYTGRSVNVNDNIALGNARGLVYYDNHLWIVDGSGAEVYKYTLDGTYTGVHFDTAAAGNTVPRGIVYYDSHFWITDGTGAEVYKYTLDGTYTGVHFDTAASGSTQPIGITFVDEHFYIVNFNSPNSVYKYEPDGTYTGTAFTVTGCSSSSTAGITYADGHLWVTFNTSSLVDTTPVCKFTLDGTYTGTSIQTAGTTNVRGIAAQDNFFWLSEARQLAAHQYVFSSPGLMVNNSLTIGSGSGAGLDNSVNNTKVTVGANLTVNNNASFVAGTSTLSFDGSGTSTINGNSTSFYNLSSTTPGKTLNFQAGETIGVTNNLSFTGASGSNISIASTSASEQWQLNLSGTGTANFVTVTNSGCNLGNVVDAQDFTNGGNNGPCWPFGTAGGGGGPSPSTGSTGSGSAGGGGGIPSVPIQSNNPQAPSTSPVSSLCYYLPGSLVRDGITIYFISKPGTAVGFTNYEAFVGLGYDKIPFTQASVADCGISGTYFLSSPTQSHSHGTWLVHQGTVYYSHETGLIPVPSMSTFNSNGGKLGYVLPANLEDLKQLNSTTPLMEANDQRVGR